GPGWRARDAQAAMAATASRTPITGAARGEGSARTQACYLAFEGGVSGAFEGGVSGRAPRASAARDPELLAREHGVAVQRVEVDEIGRASCRERVEISVGEGAVKKRDRRI